MIFLREQLGGFRSRVATILFVLTLTLICIQSFAPTQVRAHNYEPPNTTFNAISSKSNTVVAGIQESIWTKEFVLDGIAFKLAKVALQEMAGSIVQWINSGFQGSPAFVTDIEGYMLNIADQAAGSFIYGTELGFLCSPFELDIRLALELQYLQERDFEVQCRISDIVNNMENFFAGNFLDGGWQGWFELHAHPENNPYGAFLIAEHEFSGRIQNAMSEKFALLNFGDGFLSWEECSSDAQNGKETCQVQTPGKLIQEQLTFNLSSGPMSLIEADEIDEIVSALFTQLAQQAITGAGGLLGLSGGGNSGGSYVSQMQNQTDYSDYRGFTESAENPIQRSINAEQSMRALHQTIVGIINDAESYAQSRSCSNRTLSSSLRNYRTTSEQGITSANSTITELTILNNRYLATNDPVEEDAIYQEYVNMLSAGRLHNEIDVLTLEFRAEDVRSAANQFEAQVDNDCRDGGGGQNNDNL